MVLREKFEEEEKKKKEEEKEEVKFDYQTLLANTTKKYSNLKKGIGFKHSSTKKAITKTTS